MEIKIEIFWEDKNYVCAWSDPVFGAVICTAKDIDTLKANFEESLRTQIEEMIADGEEVPTDLKSGNYIISYTLATSALLREAERFTTLAVISRTCGINQKQLHHYASNLKSPRPLQRQRIIDGIRKIGQSLIAVL